MKLSPLELLTLQFVLLLQRTDRAHAFALSISHCQKNISVKYHVPVTKTRHKNTIESAATNSLETESYIDLEQRVRWELVSVCCPGFRTILFGLCQPICSNGCPEHSYCIEPERCQCKHGYEATTSAHHTLTCLPTCLNGCPEHSLCIEHNRCICRPGYRDSSSWFSPLRCERIQCGAEQRYDLARRSCVKIDMTMEELMRRVAERLAKGFDGPPHTVDEDYEAEWAAEAALAAASATAQSDTASATTAGGNARWPQ